MRWEPRPRRGSYRHAAPPAARKARPALASLTREVSEQSYDLELPRAERGRRGRKSVKRPFIHRALEWLGVLVVAVVLAALIRAFLLQAFWIPSGSMEDTLQVGDNVIVSRLTPGVWDVRRGDVVVFHDDLDWISSHEEPSGFIGALDRGLVYLGIRPDSSSTHLIKRVIGVGGDRVTCCDASGRLSVNGVSVDEPYLAPGADNSLRPFEVTVPPGRLWVMGDNRNHSADSRAHPGEPFIDLRSVVGRVIVVTYPVSRWSDPNENDVFSGVPPPDK